SFPAAFLFASRDAARPRAVASRTPHRAQDGPAGARRDLARGFREYRREFPSAGARPAGLSASSDARCAADNPAMSRRRARRRPWPPGTDRLAAGPATRPRPSPKPPTPGDGPAVPVAGRLDAESGHRVLLL